MIKDILVNLSTTSEHDAARDYAISVARVFEAHLTGVAFAYEPVIPGTIIDGGVVSVIAACRTENRKAAQSAKDRFETATKEAAVLADGRIIEAGVAGAAAIFVSSARNHDLSIVGQARPDSEAAEEMIVEGALFSSGRPVLVVPYIQQTGLKLDRVMVCWDGSRNAARAIAETIPDDQLSDDYILPSVFNPEVPLRVAKAVADTALASGHVRPTPPHVWL